MYFLLDVAGISYSVYNFSPFVLQTGPITLHIKGINYMNDDPSLVDVLYANVQVVAQETNHQIQQLCNDIADYFRKHG